MFLYPKIDSDFLSQHNQQHLDRLTLLMASEQDLDSKCWQNVLHLMPGKTFNCSVKWMNKG